MPIRVNRIETIQGVLTHKTSHMITKDTHSVLLRRAELIYSFISLEGTPIHIHGLILMSRIIVVISQSDAQFPLSECKRCGSIRSWYCRTRKGNGCAVTIQSLPICNNI